MRKRTKTNTYQRQLAKLKHDLKKKIASHASFLDRKNFWNNEKLVAEFVQKQQMSHRTHVERISKSIESIEGEIAAIEKLIADQKAAAHAKQEQRAAKNREKAEQKKAA